MYIGLDIDNTLSETSQPTLDAVNARYNKCFTLPDWNSWSLSDCFHDCPDIDTFANSLFNDEDFMYKLPVVDGAVEAATKLAKRYDIVYLTARDHNMTPATISWLFDNGFPGGQYFPNVHDKGALAREFSMRFCIDDAAHHAHSIAQQCQVYLLDYPWNQGCEAKKCTHPIFRVANWEEMKRRLCF